MIRAIKQNKKIYLLAFSMLALISLNIISTSILALVALMVFMAVVVFLKPNETFVLLFAIMPFANIFKLSPGTLSFFTVVEVLALVAMIFKNKKIKGSVLLSIIILVAYMAAFSINSFNALLLVKVAVGFLLLFYSRVYLKKEDVKNIAYLLSFSIIIMLILCQLPSYFEHVKLYIEDLNFLASAKEQVLRNSGFLGDPNYCSVLIIITLSLLCVLYYNKDMGVEFWIFFVALLSFGFFTYSKSFFLCAVVLVLFLIFFVLFPKYKYLATVALVALAVLAVLVLSRKIEVFNLILDRFDSSSDATTGRMELNREYLDYIFSDFKVALFGEGITVDRILTAKNNVHNIFIELLFKLGIFGTLLYCITLYCAFKADKKAIKKRKFINYVPSMFILVMYFFLAGITDFALPFYLIMARLALNYNSMPSKKDEMLVLQ